MRRKLSTVLILLSLSATASAEQNFDCGGSTVRIQVDHQQPLRSTEGAEVILRVERQADRRYTLLRFSNIDFIGGECDGSDQASARIVFQAACGGSGCSDLSNWGVIDPVRLQVLIAPSNESLAPVTKLLGHPPKLNSQLMSVSKEARRYGLPTP